MYQFNVFNASPLFVFFIDLKKWIFHYSEWRKKELVIVTWSSTIDFLHSLRSCLNIKKIKKKSNNIVFHYRHTTYRGPLNEPNPTVVPEMFSSII